LTGGEGVRKSRDIPVGSAQKRRRQGNKSQQSEPVFVNVKGIDIASLCNLAGRNENRVVVPARQAVNRFLSSLKGLKIWAQNLPQHVLQFCGDF